MERDLSAKKADGKDPGERQSLSLLQRKGGLWGQFLETLRCEPVACLAREEEGVSVFLFSSFMYISPAH